MKLAITAKKEQQLPCGLCVSIVVLKAILVLSFGELDLHGFLKNQG